MTKHYQLTFEGNFKNSGFRLVTFRGASLFGIKGTVMIQNQGQAVVDAEGEEQEIDKFVDWCKKSALQSEACPVVSKEVEWVGYENFTIL